MAIVGIVPEHAYGPNYGEHPIGSGRYVLKQWDRGQQVIFEANPDYYGEAPDMKRVTVSVSYTHLDVYKRQVWRRSTRISKKESERAREPAL